MYKIFIEGVVQGVGFRPYIYRKAKKYGLYGSVRNTGNGVEIVINDRNFLSKLTDLPALSKITNYTVEEVKPKNIYTDFLILKSSSSDGETELPPDIFMCGECQKEMREESNRRNNYYFITCTNCGPRFSMIEDYPYDRHLTSMNEFKMCTKCGSEYTNPLDRRYHAQTIACKECGPKLRLLDYKEDISEGSDVETIEKTAELIKSGEFVSIKGVGGFHVCSLCRPNIVRKVRDSLKRPDKPFAVMVKDTDMAEEIAHVSLKEKELLCDPKRPIVVLKKKKNDYADVSELDTLGIMLPYTGVHHLMFDYIDEPLILTSCNISGEPVAIDEKICRYFLTHERRIVNRCDDSVLKVIMDNTFLLRRSRGYTPAPVRLPIECKDTVALGAELNNVISLSKRNKCFMSQYIGDTSGFETFEFMKSAVKRFIQLTRLKPRIITCDLHPYYNTTAYAKELANNYGARLVFVQHHKAHIAGVAAEHDIYDYVGIAMDGLGYGEDGKIWGGEVFEVKDRTNFERVGHLEEQPLLGGDSAALYPKKMLFGIMSKIVNGEALVKSGLFDEKQSRLYMNMLSDNFNVNYTTSSGRILDAVSAFLGLCDKRTYDGRPAILLESAATEPMEFKPVFSNKDCKEILLTTPLFQFLMDNSDKNKGEIAATAQMYLAKGLLDIAIRKAKKKSIPIVFSGGVAYNRMISGFMIKNDVLVNKEVPCGDGGICYGQAYLANVCED